MREAEQERPDQVVVLVEVGMEVEGEYEEEGEEERRERDVRAVFLLVRIGAGPASCIAHGWEGGRERGKEERMEGSEC